MSPNDKTVLVVIGAGASRDAANGSGPVPDNALRPPIASEIFQYRDTFEPILDRYPGAKRLQRAILGPKSRVGGEFDLEQELETLRTAERTARAFYEIPPFLRDVFRRVSQHYLGHPETYLTLAMALADAHDVAFVSLNYDTLLEQALQEAYQLAPIAGLDDYAANGRPLVVKPHGSIDWWWADPYGAKTFDELLDSLALGLSSDRLRFSPGGEYADEMRLRQRRGGQQTGPDVLFYPALTAPLAEKGPDQILCPISHLEKLSEFQSHCVKYLFIGTSGWDTHVLELLNRGARSDSSAFYVGGWAPVKLDIAERVGNESRSEFRSRYSTDRTHAGSQARNAWKRISEALTAIDCEAEPFDEGFLAYSTSPAFERFLEA